MAANGSSRIVAALVALVVGFAIGWFVHSPPPAPPPPPPPSAGTQIIFVGPRASDLSAPRAKLSKSAADVVLWLGKAKSKQLLIEFTEPVFEDMKKQDNGRWVVDCKNRRCYSNEILESATYKEYKYWQVLIDANGTREEADGIIIIDR